MSKQNYDKNNTRGNAYVYGNAVRKTAVEPVRTPERKNGVNEQERRERIQRHKEIQRVHRMNFLYTLAVIGVATLIFVLCFQYLQLQSAVKKNAADVAKMEARLSQMTSENDINEVEINGNINYDNILSEAINELGMVYPSRNQVVQYNSAESEYVKQFSQIPGAK